MQRIPLSPPVIAPLKEDEARPLWSVMIPTYNCIHYLRETLVGVLSQAPDPEMMQIEVVDDCSTDGDVAGLVHEIGQGRIGFFRQTENVGSLRNFETCLNRSRGRLIHLLHGDDVVKPGFYEEINKLFKDFPDAGAAFTGCNTIDEYSRELTLDDTFSAPYGIAKNFLIRIAQRQLLQPPSIVVKRSVYEKLGSFFGVHYGEDWEMWVRIAANFPMAHSPKHLALYRRGHESNITYKYYMSGQCVRDVNKVIDIIQPYLPQEQRKVLKNRALKNFSLSYVQASHHIYTKYNNPKQAFALAYAALSMHFTPKSFYWYLKLYYRHFRNFVAKKAGRNLVK